MIKVALNGYGRIGRLVHRQLLGDPDMKVVAINARSEDTHMRAHLLKRDSLHGVIPNKVDYAEGKIIIDGEDVPCLAVKNAEDLPWKDMDIDIVLECTGKAKKYDIAERHITAGAKRVVVSAPMKDDTPTFVLGVNANDMTGEEKVISNASCTTNCIAPPIKLLHDKYGIKSASVSSIHSFTHSQNLLDNNGTDLRRARSAVQSVIPTTTGAVKATGQIIPELKGKLDGMAYRVPIATSSVSDLVIHLEKAVTADEINKFFSEMAHTKEYENILDVNDEELVSIDFKTNPHSGIIDLGLTQVVDDHYLKLVVWYDNEWGYVSRCVDMMKLVASKMK